ncbi:hypothetical protein DPMN_146738 [Dreissena polymorpha]|uniref:Uncharacterized protein n=1 Tax=Dreissena polymorpha TaxID=45954 RepID=A0A9D4FCB9_DREPO|nr:hypothetical protein DPMN_146738 [Dreissena polymorpha]
MSFNVNRDGIEDCLADCIHLTYGVVTKDENLPCGCHMYVVYKPAMFECGILERSCDCSIPGLV